MITKNVLVKYHSYRLHARLLGGSVWVQRSLWKTTVSQCGSMKCHEYSLYKCVISHNPSCTSGKKEENLLDYVNGTRTADPVLRQFVWLHNEYTS